MQGDEPILGICKPPIGGRAWKPVIEVAAGLSHTDTLEDMEEENCSGEDKADIEEYTTDVWVFTM